MTARPLQKRTVDDVTITADTSTPVEASRLAARALAAMGVVYGDIGTSPLYAVRECFFGDHAVAPDEASVLGVLSLIFWALVICISIKYVAYVLRADNHGEGGILALVALIQPEGPDKRRHATLAILGLLGAALLYGDGAITPAISVLSAIEGLEVESSGLSAWVLPLTVAMLVALFLFQRRGTAGIGAVFGPTMLLWFTVIAVLGVVGIWRHPAVLWAVSPIHAVRFFLVHRWLGFLVLGGVVLVITGGEALYADMGHFGKRPIRMAWFVVVLPALLANYFGQGALLLDEPTLAESPFYHLAPAWAHYPLVALATVATIIASQAIISGAFSMTRQAIHLGYFPRMRIIHTSAEHIGQVYLPGINWMLMVATILLVLAFQRSTHLAAAYGVAVTTTMVITTLLASVVARERWGWPLSAAIAVTAIFLVPDLAFFTANIIKIEHGGWVPIAMAAVVYLLMSTWWKGRDLTKSALREIQISLERFLDELRVRPPRRVPGTAVFLASSLHGTPLALTHHLAHNKVLHERVVLITMMTRDVPVVPPDQRVEVHELGDGVWRVVANAGFTQSPRMADVLDRCRAAGLDIDPSETSFFAGRQIVVPTAERGLPKWRGRLFAWLARNALQTTTFFEIPHERVIQIGVEIEV